MPSTGERIREIREKKRLTQDQLAEMSKISKGFLSDVENGKRNISSENLLRVANALKASVDFLLRGGASVQTQTGEPIVIPHELSIAAEHLKLSYAQTIDLLEAHRSVVARRSNKQSKSFAASDWIELHKMIGKVFGSA